MSTGAATATAYLLRSWTGWREDVVSGNLGVDDGPELGSSQAEIGRAQPITTSTGDACAGSAIGQERG